MKYIHGLLLLFAVIACRTALAQCTGGCPTGSLAMPAGSATLTAGSTYCITAATNLSGNSYTVSGTLVIQTGIVTLGNVTLNKTGVILVKFGAKLVITGILTGENTAPVSTIDNLIICNGGFLDITGSFSQGQTNIAVNDFGVMKVTGAWTAGSTTSYVKIGNGSLIELCSSFNMNKDGFFTETGTADSYLVVHAPMIQSATNGWLSNLKSASHIKWTADAGAAFVSHPAAYSCNACGNYNLAPPGTTSSCGSAANAALLTILSVRDGQPAKRPTEVITQPIAYPNPAANFIYLQLPKGSTYTMLSIFNQSGQLVHRMAVKVGSMPIKYDLPKQLSAGMYFIQLVGKEESLTLRIVKE